MAKAGADAESPVHIDNKRSYDVTFKIKVVAGGESATNCGTAAKSLVDKS